MVLDKKIKSKLSFNEILMIENKQQPKLSDPGLDQKNECNVCNVFIVYLFAVNFR